MGRELVHSSKQYVALDNQYAHPYFYLLKFIFVESRVLFAASNVCEIYDVRICKKSCVEYSGGGTVYTSLYSFMKIERSV